MHLDLLVIYCPAYGLKTGGIMTIPAQSSQSDSTDLISRTIMVDGDARMLDHMKKEAQIRGFTIMCDEREPMGGNTAPPPLAYFAASLLF